MKKNGQITGLLSPKLEKIRMEKIIKEVTGNRILDFGCGEGNISKYLKFTRYVGVDLDSNVIKKAKETHRECDNTFFFSPENFSEICDKFDTIILSAVIEHFEDPYLDIVNIKKRLDIGGEIIITSPTPIGNYILKLGSLFNFFSKEACEEHNIIFQKKDFYKIESLLGMKLIKYTKFELCLNQLVVFRDEL